jgi:hypothetical protein
VRGHKPERVDREAGVIFGVRVLGLVSDNGRRYTAEAARKAVPLYEGRKVKIDHPKRPDESRPVSSTFGWLKDVCQAQDGSLYADLHYLKAHEMAATVTEAAERNPSLFGLSHNAEGRGQNVDGVFVVEEIVEVRSVDLVDSPATNRTLFESRNMATKTVRQLVEASKVKDKAALLKLIEDMGGSYADAPVEEEADGREMLAQAVACLVGSEDAGDHELAQKVMKLLKPDEPAEEGEGDPPGDDDEDEDEDDKKKAQESKKARKRKQGEVGLTENKAKSLCKLAGLEPEASLLESLVGTEEGKALKLLEWAKGQGGAGGQGGGRPGGTKSVGQGGTQPVVESRLPKRDGEAPTKGTLSFLRGGRG